jgi:hypothetical protein
MSLTTPSSVQKLQTALHAKAKEAPNFRFYALYDKVYRKDVLAYAYERCEVNGGAAGVDNETFEDIERYGKERWLDELTQELKSRSISISMRNSAGKIVMESVIETKASMIVDFIDGLRGEVHITFEEGTWSAWLYDRMSRERLMYSVGANPAGGKVRPL